MVSELALGMETREAKRIEEAVRAALREQMEETLTLVKSTFREHIDAAFKPINDTLLRMQGVMD